MSFKRVLGQLSDKIFLDYDISKLEVTIEVMKRQVASMEARLADMKQRKDKKDMMKR